MNKLMSFVRNPGLLVLSLGHRGWFNWMDDENYLKLIYRIKMGKALNLDAPRTYNEKLQWLKLYDRNPLYTQLVDKYAVKEYVAKKIGTEYIIPTLGVWDRFEDIDFDALPDQFVLKCTHDSGGLVICRDKSKLNRREAAAKVNSCLKQNFFWGQREWPYKGVKPRIIAETYMEDRMTRELRDYKFFCFSGNVKALFIATERADSAETKFDFFDQDGRHLPFINGHPNADVTPDLPVHLEKMKELAQKLSQGIPQVRVDFYEANGRIYFGEITFFHWSGLVPFEPESWDYTFGSWLELPEAKK